MDRRSFIGATAAMAGAALLNSPGSVAAADSSIAAAKQPNILFINTDDQARWAMGAYGNEQIHTPVMDRLAAEGMRFTQAFTCPVCSPSRAMVMTGTYNHRVGVQDWIGVREPVGLPANVPTLAEELRSAGYRTGLVGKWHLGHTNHDFWPTNRGFDYFAGGLTGGNKMWDPPLMENGVTRNYKGGLTDRLADFAINFLRTRRTQPFALFFHPFRPHAPYVPVPEEDWAPYKGRTLNVPDVKGVDPKRIREITEKYYASVTSVDRNIGRLLAELEQQGELENTLIIFTGDNGYNIGQHGLWHKGNGSMLATGKCRPNMFDTSATVPMVVRWPGRVAGGSVCDELVSSLDYFPTLLNVAGRGRKPGLLLDGMDLSPLLAGESTVWRDELFLIYNQHHYTPNARMRMIRTRRWKLVHHHEPGMGHELHDFQRDPEEENNLYGGKSDKTMQDELERRLTLWEKRSGAD